MTMGESCATRRERRGVALVTTLAILVLLLLLTTGALHLAIGDARRGGDARPMVVAGAAADAGAYAVLRDLAAFDFDSMRVGDTLPVLTVAAGDGWAHVRGRRVSPLAWWITSLGFTPDTTSRDRSVRRVNLVLRQAIPQLPTDAAFTARDSVLVTGLGAVIGTDTSAGSWSAGCVPGTGVAGIAVADSGLVRHGAVTGVPPVAVDPIAGAFASYGAFGTETWQDLASRAHVVLPGGSVMTPAPRLTGGACDVTHPGNWGDPAGGPCARHAPIVWVRGDLELRGGAGQGVLLVDGDLTVSQGATYLGVVIARDDVRSAAGGGRILGAAFAADSVALPGDHSRIADGLRVQRSSCAAAGVLRRHAPMVPVTRRSWAPMP